MSQFRIEVDADDRVQLATHHLARPIVRGVRIYNDTDTLREDLTVELSIDPEVAVPKTVRLDLLAPHSVFEIPEAQLGLALSADRLANQLERQPGHIQVSLVSEGVPLAVETAAIEILAYNQWIGLASPPEMLCAFVTPNHPAVATFIGSVRKQLESHGKDGSLEGYQSRDPGRVAELAKAVFATVKTFGIGYANPPASFEASGQKIRGIEQVLGEKLGTCLDLTLLMAAALEQIGLHPIVVIQEGHAFPGVWLTDWTLPTAWVDDPAAIRKRVDLGECLVFDSSAAANSVPFAEAQRLAYSRLRDVEPFRYALDVRAARRAGVNPLGILREGSYVPVAEHVPGSDGFAPIIPSHTPLDAQETPAGRIERWKTRLLDLSLRNRLLNHRDTKLTLPLIGNAPAEIEDALEQHGRLTLRPRQGVVSEDDATRLAIAEAESKRVVVNLPAGEFDKRLTELYRRNRQMMDDSGASALFLSLGMLKWFESPSSEQERFAPLLLVPVTLARDAVGGPFHLVRSEDETIINSTLLKKLESDFGIRIPGLGGQLAADEWGVDVERNLRAVLDAVKDQKGFDVLWQAGVAFYDFQKFMMWLDLEQNAESLMSSEIVRHIIEGSEQPFPVVTSPPQPDSIASRPAHEDLSLVDADSSQVAAVFSALEGNSFVLQGPPGTGKSQTITNLIAQALGRGKSVLFVSEKRAALEVVEQRLKGVGLGPFTLEVHSDKASKSEVVKQLEDPLNFAWARSANEWSTLAAELDEVRARLNAHVTRMHETGPFGESLYQAVSRLVQLEALEAPAIPLTFARIPDLDCYQKLRNDLSALAAQTERVGDPGTHPWRFCQHDDWSTAWQNQAREAVALAKGTGDRWRAARDAAVALVTAGENTSPEVFELVGEAADMLASAPDTSPDLLRESRASIDALIERSSLHLASHQQALTTVTGVFAPSLLQELDIDAERRRFARWARAFFLFSFLMLFLARRRLAQFCRTSLGSNEEILALLDTAAAIKQEESALAEIQPDMNQYFGSIWRGSDTSVEAIQDAWKWAVAFRGVLAAMREFDNKAAARVAELAADEEARGPQTRTGSALQSLRAAAVPWGEHLAELESVLDLTPEFSAFSDDQKLEVLDTWERRLESLQGWSDWLRRSRAVEQGGLAILVESLRNGRLSAPTLLPAFERAIRERWWEARCSEDADLRQFRGRDHEELMNRFRDLDDRAKDVARKEIQARLAARLPDRSAPGEMEVLRREFSKQRRHMPVRKLFAEVPNALLRLKPCVLMSPLSVARFLDPKLSLFDIVVFDEASQIPPWDAIGAIARGKQAIIVGDSRQLPPTAFFARDDSEDEVDDEDAIELESILEQAVVRGVPQMTLNWHYRSRHESLITFSNHHYYDNRLHVFPSPHHQSEHLGLKWVEVQEGYYDRGGTRTNPGEAKRVVDEIIRRLEHPELSKKSIGVVTFSQVQQKAVEDLLDERRRKLPHLEQYFMGPESVFIKNLENVQGDERDVMLFSIGYGPDQTGRVTMAFGPLNRAGGERRLNVAVTRARELLIVFSTLRPDQIDLSRTNSLGVKHLKGFLDYAARGKQALFEATNVDSSRGFDSPFEEQVFDAVTAAGFTVHKQVGVGGFYIDLAVVDPKRPGAYLLGIECDGAAYHSARTARDRDRIRQNILESLGWTIHRIWSTDWWTQRDGELQRVGKAIRRAQFEGEKAVHLTQAFSPTPASVLPDRRDAENSTATESTPWPDFASPWQEPQTLIMGEQAEFYAANRSSTIVSQIEQIVSECAPIQLSALARYVAAAWGFSSTSTKLKDRVRELARRSGEVHEVAEVYWQSPEQERAWKGFRYPDSDSRAIEEIPDVEIEWATGWVLERALSLDRDALVFEVLKTFGYQRLGSKIREPVESTVDALIRDGRLREGAGKITRNES